MPLIENLDFNGSSNIVQYIPTVDEEPGREKDEEKNSTQIEMDFSTPIQDVMPSGPLGGGGGSMLDDTPGLNGPYTSPTNNRVVGISGGVIAPQAEKSGAKNSLGLTAEQLQALVSGIIAIAVFSKPVQTKLTELVPKFLGESGDLSLTGMVVTALIAAILFYFAMDTLKGKI